VNTVDATNMQKTVQNTVAWGQNHIPQKINHVSVEEKEAQNSVNGVGMISAKNASKR
tara:strand:+ start:308 stop:478 length:171 start_codon:yes stop_codon:yes gene_type:complete